MPQIAQLAATYSSQIFWLLLTFGFVFFVIGLGMVPKVQSTVDMRDKRISDDLDAAKASFARADTLEEEWRAKENAARAEAQALVAEAKAKAATENEARIAAADAELNARIAEAEAAVAQARQKAMSEIEGIAADAAADIAARIAGTTTSPDAAREAVRTVLNG